MTSSLPQEWRSIGLPAAWAISQSFFCDGEDVLAQHGGGGHGGAFEAEVVVEPVRADGVHLHVVLDDLHEHVLDLGEDRLDQVGLLDEGVGEHLEAHEEGDVFEGAAGDRGR